MTHPDEMATVWVIRGGSRNHLVAEFLRDGAIGVGFPELPDGRDLDRSRVLRLLGADPMEPTPSTEADAAMFLSFVRRMSIGDIVAMPDPQERGVVFGVVAGDYAFDADLAAERNRHRRPVEWRRRLPEDALPERLAGVARPRRDIDDMADGKLRDLALRCCAEDLGEDPHVRRSPPVRSANSGTRRPRKPPRPPKATTPEKRCMNCFLSKPAELFEEGGDWCRDCR